MKYIDDQKIQGLLKKAGQTSPHNIDQILERSLKLKGLGLEETAALLSVSDPEGIARIFKAAAHVKNEIYGSRIVLFAPLYITNFCSNGCRYCAFKADNTAVKRKALSRDEIKQEVKWLLERGHKRLLIVAGESQKEPVESYVEAIEAAYSVQVGSNRIRRANINCAPLSVDDFRQLKKAGIGTYQIFQETYHDASYRYLHPYGPKSDPDNRLDAVDRAMTAGIDDIGIGVLYGLYDYRYETLSLLEHVRHMEETFGVGPHTISVPRVEPAVGLDFFNNLPFPLTDEDFKKTVAILRLAVPYTGIILSTRETAHLRNELFGLGVSQVSAESKTSPGGYTVTRDEEAQFVLSDSRSLDDVIYSLLERRFIPSFCAACYRKERTGQAFMSLAKPGTIKGKCQMNALVTLKEYLDDFASPRTRELGYSLIETATKSLDEESRQCLGRFFEDMEKGVRDEYV